MRLLFVLGSNDELSKKEIEAAATILPLLWNSSMLRPGLLELKTPEALPWEGRGIEGYLSQEATELRHAIATLQARLGGTIQIIYLWQQSSLRDAPTVLANCMESIPVDVTRWKLAVRSFGSVDAERLALQVKRELKSHDLSLRYLPSKGGVAGVFHEKLDLNRFNPAHPGMEVAVISEGQGLWLGVTLSVQDIDEYTRRDFGIPVPDPVSGMLPPKLAQLMINVAVGQNMEANVYDPFCGNGRILLEAAQMGLKVYGSDIEATKVEASKTNTTWLLGDSANAEIWQDDATVPKRRVEAKNIVIVTEPYLGRPLRQLLLPAHRKNWLDELAKLYLGFFQNWQDQDFQNMVIIFPAANLVGGGQASLYEYLFDRLLQMGYAPKRLGQYARPDALVARDLVKITHAQ